MFDVIKCSSLLRPGHHPAPEMKSACTWLAEHMKGGFELWLHREFWDVFRGDFIRCSVSLGGWGRTHQGQRHHQPSGPGSPISEAQDLAKVLFCPLFHFQCHSLYLLQHGQCWGAWWHRAEVGLEAALHMFSVHFTWHPSWELICMDFSLTREK